MSFQAVVAAPFRQRGRDRLTESEFVVALSLDRDWFSPDQAANVAEIGLDRGLLERDGDDLIVAFDPESVSVPEGFAPGADLLVEPSVFERVLEALLDDGADKQEAVAGINRVQADLGLTLEAAAVVFARRQGLDVSELVEAARVTLADGS